MRFTEAFCKIRNKTPVQVHKLNGSARWWMRQTRNNFSTQIKRARTENSINKITSKHSCRTPIKRELSPNRFHRRTLHDGVGGCVVSGAVDNFASESVKTHLIDSQAPGGDDYREIRVLGTFHPRVTGGGTFSCVCAFVPNYSTRLEDARENIHM